MFKFILSLALAAASSSALAAAPSAQVGKTWTDAKGGVHVTLLKPGVLKLCSTKPQMDVETNGRSVTIQGGRVCASGEQPTLTIDTSPTTCGMTAGNNTGTLTMSCTFGR